MGSLVGKTALVTGAPRASAGLRHDPSRERAHSPIMGAAAMKLKP